MIHDLLFVGMWISGERRGHVYGEVVPHMRLEQPRQFTIERSSEFLREWWTGTDWPKDYRVACWYENEPAGPRETEGEEAHPVYYASGKVEPG